MNPADVTNVVSAATKADWVAGLFAILVVAGFAGFGYIIRQLWTDHRDLNRFVREYLTDVIDDNTVCMARTAMVFKSRPCLTDSDLDRIATGNGGREDTPDLDATARRAIQRRQARQAKQ